MQKFMMKSALLVSALAMAASASAGDLKVGGFANAGFGLNLVSGASPMVTGFAFGSGALKASKEMGNANFMLDIPFMATNNSMTLGGADYQAYVTHKFDNGLNWSLGRFDRILGHEANDVSDRFFLSTGLLHGLTPNTHMGLRVGYDMGSIGIDLVFTNQTNKGPHAAATDNFEFGGAVKFGAGDLHAKAGLLVQNPNGAQSTILVDANVGTKFGALAADVGFDLVSAGGTNIAFDLALIYWMNSIGLGARGEFQSSAGTTTIGADAQVTYQVTKEFDLRLAWGMQSAGGTMNPHGVSLGATYMF